MFNANNSNYYEILGVESSVNNEDIKRAYRRQSLIYHPDKHNNDVDKATRFKLLNDAYHILSNVETRRQYDRHNNIRSGANGLNIEKDMNFINNNNGLNGVNMANGDNMVNGVNMANGDNMVNSVNVDRMNNKNRYFHDKNNLNPNTFKYNQHPNRNDFDSYNRRSDIMELRHNQIKPRPIEIFKEITLNESYFGTSIAVNIAREIHVGYEKYRETETVYIEGESGTDNDEIIIIYEKGNIINDVCGDVRIKIVLCADNDKQYKFKRRGLDLVYTKTITLKESLCGFTFVIKHINGRQYTINNNTGIVIYPNYSTSIPKLGFKKGSNMTGNLVIEYNIEYPERLDEDCRERLKDIL